MRFLRLGLWLCFAFASLSHCQPHLDTARSYLGVTELTGHNDGPLIEIWQSDVGLQRGAPYCAAFVSYCLSATQVTSPAVRSGLARSFYTKHSVSAREVMFGSVKVHPGWIIIWQLGKSIKGHVGFVENWKGISGTTIEANTSPGEEGSQSNGDGVYRKHRQIEWVSLHVLGFTPVIP